MALEAIGGEPVDLGGFHGDDPGVGYAVDLLVDSTLLHQMEELQAAAVLDPLGDATARERAQRLLLLTAVLRVDVERQAHRIVEPGELEAQMLQLVAAFREEGDAWPEELQLVALRADAWLRRLGVVRARWQAACSLLGLDLADALDEALDGDGRCRWWWPHEVPERPLYTAVGRPYPARPVIYLPDYDGPRDVLGLGEGWVRGEALVVGVGFVRECWPSPSRRPVEQRRPDPVITERVEGDEVVVEVPQRYVDVGLEHLDEFLRGSS